MPAVMENPVLISYSKSGNFVEQPLNYVDNITEKYRIIDIDTPKSLNSSDSVEEKLSDALPVETKASIDFSEILLNKSTFRSAIQANATEIQTIKQSQKQEYGQPQQKNQGSFFRRLSMTSVLGSGKSVPSKSTPTIIPRRASLAHPGIPSIAIAGPAFQTPPGQPQGRRSSLAIKDGTVTIQPLVSAFDQLSTRPLYHDNIARIDGSNTALNPPFSSTRIESTPYCMTISKQSLDVPSLGNQYLSSNTIDTFKSVAEFPDGYLLGFSDCSEVDEPIEMNVIGTIPTWLAGVFYRCGPGKFSIETELLDEAGDNKRVEIEHWFDGFSLLHRFEVLKDGRVVYRNRFTSLTQEDQMRKTGALPLSFAQSQNNNAPKGMFDMFSISTNVPEEFNVNIAVTPRFPMSKQGETTYREILLAKTDANVVQEIDHDTLVPAGYSSYTHINSKFRGVMTAAHELYDPKTGEYINFLQEPGPYVKTRVFSISRANPHGEIIAAISSLKASYMHSFSITENYIILIFCPYTWKFGGLPIVFTKKVSSALVWDDNVPTYFHVIDRRLKRVVVTYESDAFFMFHTINAFEENDNITIDLCAYPNPLIIQEMYLDKFRNGTTELEQSHIHRYQLSNISHYAKRGLLSRSIAAYPRATFDILSGPGPELPVINTRWAYRNYRYVYCVIASQRMPFEALGKYDLITKTNLRWQSPACYPSEPVFVARPGAKEEDDGALLSIVLDASRCRSFMLVLDARTFTEIGRAEMPNNKVVPFGFHGSFMDKSTIQT